MHPIRPRLSSRATGIVALCCLLGAAPPPSVGAQVIQVTRDGDVANPRSTARSDLEARAAAAERAAASTSHSAEEREQKRVEASMIRARLRDGDFRPGDRIVITVRPDSTLTDTFTVSADRTLRFPDQPEIPLHGVLRPELKDHLRAAISRFVRNPSVEAQPLIRLAVLGQVTSPGYYQVTPDFLVSDAIMTAGGPTSGADLTRTTVRRGDATLWDRGQLRTAIVDGATLERLALRSGDEIIVGEKKRNWDTILRTASIVSGIALSVYGATTLMKR